MRSEVLLLQYDLIMLIATPKIVDEYVKQIPEGKSVSLQTMRKDLAEEFKAEYTCPVTHTRKLKEIVKPLPV